MTAQVVVPSEGWTTERPTVAVACGGCGNADPEKVCIGCRHPFAAPPSAPVGAGAVIEILDRLIREVPMGIGHMQNCLAAKAILAQQPAAVAPVVDEVVASLRNAAFLYEDGSCARSSLTTAALLVGHIAAKQPAAVDEAMVERATTAYLQSRGTYEGEVPVDRDDIRAALTAALATQHKEPKS